MLFADIIEGREPTKVLTITDTSEHRGLSLLMAMVSSHLESGSDAIARVYLLETNPDWIFQVLACKHHARVVCVDGYSDPNNWKIRDDISADKAATASIGDLRRPNCLVETTEAAAAVEGVVGRRRLVVVDSLSRYTLLHQIPAACRSVQKLCSEQRTTQFVTVLHRTLHESSSVAAIEHLATSRCTLVNLKGDSGQDTTYELVHRRRTGKIVKEAAAYRIANDSGVKVFRVGSDGAAMMPTPTVKDRSLEPDPTAGLTFDLTLSESEKKARAGLVLPYKHSDARKTIELKTGATSQIYYQPDDDDDFDDEDPDDDLDI